jgi:threonine dehydrogenase-like Zn-dependent dehydrogenase
MLAGHIPARGRIELVEVPEPGLQGPAAASAVAQVIFQPRLACLCGSDLPYFDDEDGVYPRTPGHSLHEMVGEVVASSGGKFRPGDRVLAVPTNQLGFFERYAVSEERVLALDPRLSEEHAVLAQPLGTVLYALRRLPSLIGLRVAVVGQGPIGQLFNACLCCLGAREVVAIDRLPSRLATSLRMGATHVVSSADVDPVAAVTRLTGGEMADLVVEAVGHRDQALNLCVDLCRHAGRILSFGVPPPQIDGLRWRDLFFKNITVHTSVNPDFRVDFPLAMRFLAEGRIDASALITHRFPVAKVQSAFETFRDRREGALKVLLEFRR